MGLGQWNPCAPARRGCGFQEQCTPCPEGHWSVLPKPGAYSFNCSGSEYSCSPGRLSLSVTGLRPDLCHSRCVLGAGQSLMGTGDLGGTPRTSLPAASCLHTSARDRQQGSSWARLGNEHSRPPTPAVLYSFGTFLCCVEPGRLSLRTACGQV